MSVLQLNMTHVSRKRQALGIEFVAVMSEKNPCTGSIAQANIKLTKAEELSSFRARMWGFYQDKVEEFEIPIIPSTVFRSERNE